MQTPGQVLGDEESDDEEELSNGSQIEEDEEMQNEMGIEDVQWIDGNGDMGMNGGNDSVNGSEMQHLNNQGWEMEVRMSNCDKDEWSSDDGGGEMDSHFVRNEEMSEDESDELDPDEKSWSRVGFVSTE